MKTALALSILIHGTFLFFVFFRSNDVTTPKEVVLSFQVVSSPASKKTTLLQGFASQATKTLNSKALGETSDVIGILNSEIQNKLIYPPRAVAMNLQGVVKIVVRVDRDGHAVQIDFSEKSQFDDLNDAVFDAVKSWQFPKQAANLPLEFYFRLR